MYASTGFTPAARIRTSTSPAPGFGSGTSSSLITSGPPCCRTMIACMDKVSRDGGPERPARRQSVGRIADAMIENPMPELKLYRTVGVKVGHVLVGGGAPIVVQSMTMTDTADARATAQQCCELADAGSEMVRVTVNLPEAAAAVPEIKQRMLDAGCTAPLIGDFHYNGHLLLTRYPDCARALDKYRINPGNVGTGKRRDEQFSTICKVAIDNAKPVRIGVNGGSLNQELVV